MQNGLRYDLELGMLQDLHFNVRYFQYCNKIVYDPEPVYHYSIDTGGVTQGYTTLTPRKISGLQSYIKIAELMHDKFPRVEEMAYSSLCNMCLRYMIIYYRLNVRSRDKLKLIYDLYYNHRRYFYRSDIYGHNEKQFSRLAAIHPYLYYTAGRIRWHWNHLFSKKKTVQDE